MFQVGAPSLLGLHHGCELVQLPEALILGLSRPSFFLTLVSFKTCHLIKWNCLELAETYTGVAVNLDVDRFTAVMHRVLIEIGVDERVIGNEGLIFSSC